MIESVSKKAEGKPVDIKAFPYDEDIRAYFEEILPAFDKERVYTSDIKKLLSWYNILIGAGITEFVAPAEENATEETAEKDISASHKSTKAPISTRKLALLLHIKRKGYMCTCESILARNCGYSPQ